jgi:hypothetical protein
MQCAYVLHARGLLEFASPIMEAVAADPGAMDPFLCRATDDDTNC